LKIIIIGAGLGGLESGYLLSKAGHDVCVLEKNPKPGGCLQTFQRGNCTFDTGFHYVGGLCEGDVLHPFFKELGLLQLPWHQLDTDCFDEVLWNGQSYGFANGYENFSKKMSEYFPKEEKSFQTYVQLLRQIADCLAQNDGANLLEAKTAEFLSQSAYHFLQKEFSDSTVRNVLSGTSLKMELNEMTPLYIFAQSNGSYLQSAWRLKGGGHQIIDALAKGIISNGGKVITNAEVTGFKVNSDSIDGVIINTKETMNCDAVVSDIHPAVLLPLLPDGVVRKVHTKRVCALRNSAGMFTAHLKLKPGKVAYRNRNIFIHEASNLWHEIPSMKSVCVHFSVPESGNSAQSIDLFTPMEWSDVARFADTKRGQRGSEYEEFKAQTAQRLIQTAQSYLPDLKGNIESIYTSTPLTYRDYTGTYEGSAFGILKDYDRLLATMLPLQAPAANLYYTGQNVNFHGVLGVTFTAKALAAELCK